MAGVKGRSGVYTRTEKHNENMSKSKLFPREIRVCGCRCGGTFVCIVTSKQKYIHGHAASCQSQATKDKRNRSNTGKERTQEHRDNIGIASKENWKDKKYRKKQTKSHIEAWKDAEYKKSQSKIRKENWQDKEYREKTLKAQFESREESPNGCEKFLIKLLDELFPLKFKFVGDGKFWLDGYRYNPDFVDEKNKLIIEHYGDLWHADKKYCDTREIKEVRGVLVETIRKNDKERLETFENLGWKVLIIWEHELQDTVKLKRRLVEFQKERTNGR